MFSVKISQKAWTMLHRKYALSRETLFIGAACVASPAVPVAAFEVAAVVAAFTDQWQTVEGGRAVILCVAISEDRVDELGARVPSRRHLFW